MAIAISCGKCGKRYSVKEELAGKKIRCKECETLIAIPLPDNDDDPFGGMKLKSTGRAVDDEEDDDDGEDLRPVRRTKLKNKSTSRRNWRPSDGMPLGVILAISAVAILMALNSFATLSFFLNPSPLLIVPAIRAVIEWRVISGLRQRLSQTRLTATVMAALMSLIIATIWFGVLENPAIGGIRRPPEEIFFLRLVLGIQAGCEIIVIVGLNLSSSRRYLTE